MKTTYSTTEYLSSPNLFDMNLSLAEDLLTSCRRKINCGEAKKYANFILENAKSDAYSALVKSVFDVCLGVNDDESFKKAIDLL